MNGRAVDGRAVDGRAASRSAERGRAAPGTSPRPSGPFLPSVPPRAAVHSAAPTGSSVGADA